MDDLAKRRIGQTLRGKYRLDTLLGSGGMGAVYAATHRNRKRFAVKMLHAEWSNNEEVRTRFLREGYVANSVNHRGAVTVFDDDVAEDGSAFLVMELLDGTSVDMLADWRGGNLPVSAALAIGDQLLDVLTTAHLNGIIHRDLKPANLFLTRDGVLRVLDFGIARLREATLPQAATQTGAALGTPAFMAPEQALGKVDQLDARVDIFAAGATLFLLLSGELVHLGDNPQHVLINAATKQVRSLGSVTSHVTPDVVALVDRAQHYDAQERWPSAAVMREALQICYKNAFGDSLRDSPRVLRSGLLAEQAVAVGVSAAGSTGVSATDGTLPSPPSSPGRSMRSVPPRAEQRATSGPRTVFGSSRAVAMGIVGLSICLATGVGASLITSRLSRSSAPESASGGEAPTPPLSGTRVPAAPNAAYSGASQAAASRSPRDPAVPDEQSRTERAPLPATGVASGAVVPAASLPPASIAISKPSATAASQAAKPAPSTSGAAANSVPASKPAPGAPVAAPAMPEVCARLLERLSLGEDLTASDKVQFAQCHK